MTNGRRGCDGLSDGRSPDLSHGGRRDRGCALGLNSRNDRWGGSDDRRVVLRYGDAA